MTRRRGGISLVLLLWIIIGVILAIIRDYINETLLIGVGSALLAILLWPLLLLGIDLRIG